MPVAVQGGLIAFDELDDSPQISVSQRSRSAVRRGRIAWSDIDALIAECVPPLGERPARYPGVPQLCVSDLSIVPDEDSGLTCSGDVKVYSHAFATLRFSTPSYDPDDGNLLEINRDYGGQLLTLPGEGFKWLSDGVKVEIDDIRPAQVVPETTLSITQHRLASSQVPRAAMRAAQSKVNDAPWMEYPSECVLYLGACEQQTLNALGQLETRVSHKLIVRSFVDDGVQVTHNHVWRPSSRQFEKLCRVDSSPTLFMYELTGALDDIFYQFS